MLIGELARRTGVTTATIRFYEAERLLAPQGRQNGRRVYAETATERLRLIAAMQAAGFTLRELRDLLALLETPGDLSQQWHHKAHRKLEELDEAMRRIRAARRVLRDVLACGCDSAAECSVIARWTVGAAPPRDGRGAVVTRSGKRARRS